MSSWWIYKVDSDTVRFKDKHFGLCMHESKGNREGAITLVAPRSCRRLRKGTLVKKKEIYKKKDGSSIWTHGSINAPQSTLKKIKGKEERSVKESWKPTKLIKLTNCPKQQPNTGAGGVENEDACKVQSAQKALFPPLTPHYSPFLMLINLSQNCLLFLYIYIYIFLSSFTARQSFRHILSLYVYMILLFFIQSYVVLTYVHILPPFCA